MCGYMAMFSLKSQRHGDMAAMTGVLQWKDTDSLGRTDWGDEEGALPSMSMTSWSVELCLGMDEELTVSLWEDMSR